MNVYKGSCHCGEITFEVRREKPIEVLIDCNCSICSKKGLVHNPGRERRACHPLR